MCVVDVFSWIKNHGVNSHNNPDNPDSPDLVYVFRWSRVTRVTRVTKVYTYRYLRSVWAYLSWIESRCLVDSA